MQKPILKGELVRITTNDGLELHGLLAEPAKETDKIIIHNHGWTGNFYENVFLDYIADSCVKNKYSFLTINTRGAGYIQEFLQKHDNKIEYVKIGGSLEKFTDCLIDLQSIINFVQRRRYKEIFLQGHSTGCQKVSYYTLSANIPAIKGLILLEPADDPSVMKRFLGGRYQEAMLYAKKLVSEKKPNNPMPDWIPFNVCLSAQKFLSMSDPTSTEGELFYVPGKCSQLKKLTLPILVISAENSEYQNAQVMQEKLKKYLVNCEAYIVEDTNHWFFRHEKDVARLITSWILRSSGV